MVHEICGKLCVVAHYFIVLNCVILIKRMMLGAIHAHVREILISYISLILLVMRMHLNFSLSLLLLCNLCFSFPFYDLNYILTQATNVLQM